MDAFSQPHPMAFCFPETASGFLRSMPPSQKSLSKWQVFCVTHYRGRGSPHAGFKEFLRSKLVLRSLAVGTGCVRRPRSTSAMWLSHGAHSPIHLASCHISGPRNRSEEESHMPSLPLSFPDAHGPDWRDLADGVCQTVSLQMAFWQIACSCCLS